MENESTYQIPESAYFFIPNKTKIVEHDPKKPEKTLRKIFEGKTDLLDYEKERLKSLFEDITKHNLNLDNSKDFVELKFPPKWRTSDTLRFHQATSYKNQETIKLLILHFIWKNSYFPFELTIKADEILNSGFLYIHGRDQEYRPIIVINAKFYTDNYNKYLFDDWLCCTVYFMEYIINNLLIPGQVENWNIISDFNGVSLLTLPSDFKKMINFLTSNYRNRLNVNYILGMSFALNLLWKIIKNFLEETTVRKIRFLKKGDFKDIFEYTNEDQVELRFGGKADNIQGKFFPPIFPSNNYRKSNDNHVSEKEYIEMIKKESLTKTSPFIIKKYPELENHLNR